MRPIAFSPKALAAFSFPGTQLAARNRKSIPNPLASTGTTTINREVLGDEYVTDLRDIGQRMRTYTKMRRGDGAVNTSLLAIEKPILGARWGVDGDDPKIVEACDTELFSSDRGPHHDPPLFELVLAHLLGMFQYGFAAAEPFWEIGDDGLVHCTNSTLIRQESVRTFRLDSRGFLESLVQYTSALDMGWREITVPASQLLLAVHAREGADYSGVAIVRSSYRAWLSRDLIQKCRLMYHDRFGSGTPTAVYPEGANDDIKGEVNEALENWRAGAKSYIAVPFGTTLDVKGGEGAGYDPTNELAAYAGEISKNTLSQLMELGTSGNTGNRALGNSLGAVLKQALQGYAEYLAAIIRRQLLTPFVKWNFGDAAEVPQIRCRVTLSGISELFDAVMIAVDAGMKLEPEDIAALRDELELPEIPLDELKARIEARRPDVQPGQSPPAAGAAVPPGDAPFPKPKLVTASETDPPAAPSDAPMAPDYLGRLRPAKVVALEDRIVKPKLLADQLDREAVRATADVHDVLKEIDSSLVAQVKQLAEAGGQALASKVSGITVPGVLRSRLRKAIATSATRAQKIGQQSVRQELERQGLNLEAAQSRRLALMERWGAPVALGDPDLYGGLAAFLKALIQAATDREVAAREQGAQLSALAALGDAATETELDWAAIAQRVQSELESRSVAAVESRVTQVLNVSFGQGRVETGQLFGADIESMIRSEVLDGNTCDWCREHDGDEYAFGDPSAPELPDVNCEGTWNCRGLFIYALKQRAA